MIGFGLKIGKFISGIVEIVESTTSWILSSGFWADFNQWIDSETWID